MKNIQRLKKKEIEFFSQFNDNFHLSVDEIIQKINGPKINDPKYWELKTEINKLKNKLEKLQDFIDAHTGY